MRVEPSGQGRAEVGWKRAREKWLFPLAVLYQISINTRPHRHWHENTYETGMQMWDSEWNKRTHLNPQPNASHANVRNKLFYKDQYLRPGIDFGTYFKNSSNSKLLTAVLRIREQSVPHTNLYYDFRKLSDKPKWTTLMILLFCFCLLLETWKALDIIYCKNKEIRVSTWWQFSFLHKLFL